MATKKKNRFEKVADIHLHAKEIGSNITTITFLLGTMNDKALTKFHKEYLEIKPEKK